MPFLLPASNHSAEQQNVQAKCAASDNTTAHAAPPCLHCTTALAAPVRCRSLQHLEVSAPPCKRKTTKSLTIHRTHHTQKTSATQLRVLFLHRTQLLVVRTILYPRQSTKIVAVQTWTDYRGSTVCTDVASTGLECWITASAVSLNLHLPRPELLLLPPAALSRVHLTYIVQRYIHI